MTINFEQEPNKIKRLRGTPDIKIVSGLRRSGKSQLLKSYMEYLRENLVAEPFVDLQHCSCVFFITSFFERVLIKYGDRGYRFILQEVGFLTQNISLLAEFLELGSCVLGSYVDDNINQILSADGTFETVQNVIVIGKNKEVQDDNVTSK